MRALIFDGTSARLNAAHPPPSPQPGEAVVRLLKAAVSSTDLEICKGALDFKGVLGHQFVGTGESVHGSEGKALVGKRVGGAIAPAGAHCDM